MEENYLTFKNAGWELVLNLQGGRIVYLNYQNKNILGSFTRMDGKEGSTHLCLPNFGVEGEDKYGLPFHGFARNSYWKKGEKSHQYLSISTWIKATHKYESDLQVIQKFILDGKSFSHEVLVTNQGNKSVPVNIGIHNYWNTIQGWEGLAINGYKVADLVKENGFINIGEKNEIVFPIGNKIIWELKNFNRAVLWSAQKDGHYNADFVCIEPVKEYAADYFGSAKSLLASKKTFVCSQKIII